MSEFNLEENLNKIADVLGDRLEEMLERQSKYKKRIEELEQTNHELIEKNKALYHENSFLRKELEKTNEALYAAEGNNIRLMKELEGKDEVKKLNEQILALEEKNRKLLQSNKDLTEKIDELNNEISDLEKENDKLNDEIWDLEEKIDKLNDQSYLFEIDYLEEENDKLNDKIRDLEEEIETLKGEVK